MDVRAGIVVFKKYFVLLYLMSAAALCLSCWRRKDSSTCTPTSPRPYSTTSRYSAVRVQTSELCDYACAYFVPVLAKQSESEFLVNVNKLVLPAALVVETAFLLVFITGGGVWVKFVMRLLPEER